MSFVIVSNGGAGGRAIVLLEERPQQAICVVQVYLSGSATTIAQMLASTVCEGQSVLCLLAFYHGGSQS